MDYHALAQKITAFLPCLALAEDEPMARHCSFRVGGPAAVFAEPASETELSALLGFLKSNDETPVIVGNGTNLLVRDKGIRAVVIHIGERFSSMDFIGNSIYAQAGIRLSRLAQSAKDKGLSGLEFAHGIPGSLGGAVVMNAGAYGGEMKDVVHSVRWMDLEGNISETDNPDFGYRRSAFSGGDCLVLGALLSLFPGDSVQIGARMEELRVKRQNSQPLQLPSAGSTFKRPPQGFAAAMIDGAGLKGLRVGDAMVSEKHAGFVVNAGNASCADVLSLMEKIQSSVYQQYGVLLEPEVRILG